MANVKDNVLRLKHKNKNLSSSVSFRLGSASDTRSGYPGAVSNEKNNAGQPWA
jgi:hypothetical protein